MLSEHAVSLVDRLVELDDSTTLFLESIRGDTLKVMMESQEESGPPDHRIIRRVVRLYFDEPDRPVLYCTSFINRDLLTKEEHHALMEEYLPMGIVFHSFNSVQSIKKKKITVSSETNPLLAAALYVQSAIVFTKRYDYWVGDRQIGVIYESFNEESLMRI